MDLHVYRGGTLMLLFDRVNILNVIRSPVMREKQR